MPGELISREALERIIQRAAELQAGERDIGEGLTKDELLALGRDVGIPARYLQQALLDEQTRVVADVPRGFWGWLAGPVTLGAARVVPGDRGAVEQALAVWMEDEELLQLKRRFPDRVSWEPKTGAFASIQRALGARGRRYALAQASEVNGQVTALEAGFCHVRLGASVSHARRMRLTGAAVAAGLGLLAALAAGPLGVIAVVPYVAAGGMAVAALAIARRHAPENERIQIGLEQVLDRLERSEIRADHQIPGPRASAFVRIADEIRKTFDMI